MHVPRDMLVTKLQLLTAHSFNANDNANDK